MNYLRTLALHMEAMEVQTLTLTSAEQEMALGKIITWTYEPKSVEVRKAAMASVVALFRLNANHFSMVLHKLPKVYQDNAADLVAEFVMSASSATLTDSMTRSSDLTSAMKPINAPEANNGGGLTVSLSKKFVKMQFHEFFFVKIFIFLKITSFFYHFFRVLWASTNEEIVETTTTKIPWTIRKI